MAGKRDMAADRIHAYVDGRLAADRRVEVETYLVDHPEEAARAADYRRINESLRSLFAPVRDEPVPLRLLVREGRRRMSWAPLAAALACLLVGAGGGWLLHAGIGDAPSARSASGLARQAMTAHAVYVPEVRHPVEVDAAQHDHLVRWLSKRLGGPVKAPDLGAAGFALIGGRLLPSDAGPAALFMYENGRGERVTLYVRAGGPDRPGTAFRYEARKDGPGVVWWIDRSFGYALAGPGERERLERIAHLVYEQINP